MAYKGYRVLYSDIMTAIANYRTALVNMGWVLHDAGVGGSSILSSGTLVTNGQTTTIASRSYTWRTTLTPATDEVLIGGSIANAFDNLKLAINGDVGTYGVNHYCSTASAHVSATDNTDTSQKIESLYPYTYYNITVSESSNFAWSVTTLAGNYPPVYKSNGEAGTRPYGYLWIDVASSTTIRIKTYGYWDAATHIGSCGGFTSDSYNAITFAADTYWGVYGNKDWVYFSSNHTAAGYQNKSIVYRPTHYINESLTTTTDAITSGSNVSIPVTSSTGFVKGMYVTIFSPIGEGRDKLCINSIPDGSHIIVDALPRAYSSGAFIGQPAMCFGSTGATNVVYQMGDCGHFALVGTTTGTNTQYTATAHLIGSHVAYTDPDAFTMRYIITPILVLSYTTGLIGYLADGYIGGASGVSLNDVIGVNNNGETCESGNETSCTNNTLTDSSKSWTPDTLIGKYIVLSDGTGATQIRKITDNTSDTVTVQANWNPNPDTTTDFKICDKAYRVLDDGDVAYYGYTCVLETDHTI